MKIFVTGIAGFFSHVASFRDDGHEVIGCDNLLGGYEDNVPMELNLLRRDLRDDLHNLMQVVLSYRYNMRVYLFLVLL